MTSFGNWLLATGLVAILVGIYWFTVEAFREGPGWGFICLANPLACLVFLILHWDKASRPLGVIVGGIGTVIGGAIILVQADG